MSTTILDQLLQDHHEYGHEVADFMMDAGLILAVSQLDTAMKLEVLSHFEHFSRALGVKVQHYEPLVRQEKALTDRIVEQDPSVMNFIAGGLAALALGLIPVRGQSPELARALTQVYVEFLNGFMSEAEIEECNAEITSAMLSGAFNVDEMTGDLILLANGIRP